MCLLHCMLIVQVTKRTEGTIRENVSKRVYKVSKGAPHILLKLLTGPSSHAMHEAVESDVRALGTRGIRCLAVARTDFETGEWKMLGLLTFLDPPRHDTKQVSGGRTLLLLRSLVGYSLFVADCCLLDH